MKKENFQDFEYLLSSKGGKVVCELNGVLCLFEFVLICLSALWTYDQYKIYKLSDLCLFDFVSKSMDAADYCVMLIFMLVGANMILFINVVPYVFNFNLAYV